MTRKKAREKTITTTTCKRLVMTTLADVIAEEVLETITKTADDYWLDHNLRLGFSLRNMEWRIRCV